MATILEGLNKLSGALGGAETATENLEALNAIAGALGGETTATNNADAIDQIAEHASGGGGSSDFSTAEVTIVNNSQGIFTLVPTTLELDSKLLGFRWTTNGVDSQQEYEYIQNTETTDKFYISRGYYMFGYNQTLADAAAYTVTGNAEVTVVDNMPAVKITGDCTITMQ